MTAVDDLTTLVEEFEKREHEFNEAAQASKASKSGKVSSVVNPIVPNDDVNGLQCLDSLVKMLEMLCVLQKENVSVRRRCNYLEESMKEIRAATGSEDHRKLLSSSSSAVHSGQQETSRLNQQLDDGNSLGSRSHSLDYLIKPHEGLPSPDLDRASNSTGDSKGSGRHNWIDKVKNAISVKTSGDTQTKRSSEENLQKHKKEVFSDQDDGGFKQREVPFSEPAQLTMNPSDFGGVWLGPDDSGNFADSHNIDDTAHTASVTSGATAYPEDSPVADARLHSKSKLRLDSEPTKARSSFDDVDSRPSGSSLLPFPPPSDLLTSSIKSQSVPIEHAIPQQSPIPRKPKRASTIGLGEAKKHRRNNKDSPVRNDDFLESLEKSMSKDFRKKMESWSSQSSQVKVREDESESVPNTPTQSGERRHPILGPSTSHPHGPTLQLTKPKGKQMRFKDRVKREWEKRRSKSKDRGQLMQAAMNRSKSCERPGHEKPVQSLSQTFTEKLREWSVIKGKGPDYYTSPTPRPRCGSMPKSSMEQMRSGAKRSGGSDEKKSSNLLSPEDAKWISIFTPPEGAPRQSRSRSRTLGHASQASDEGQQYENLDHSPRYRHISGERETVSSHQMCYSSDESLNQRDEEHQAQDQTPDLAAQSRESTAVPTLTVNTDQTAVPALTVNTDQTGHEASPAGALLLNSPPPIITLDKDFLDNPNDSTITHGAIEIESSTNPHGASGNHPAQPTANGEKDSSSMSQLRSDQELSLTNEKQENLQSSNIINLKNKLVTSTNSDDMSAIIPGTFHKLTGDKSPHHGSASDIFYSPKKCGSLEDVFAADSAPNSPVTDRLCTTSAAGKVLKSSSEDKLQSILSNKVTEECMHANQIDMAAEDTETNSPHEAKLDLISTVQVNGISLPNKNPCTDAKELEQEDQTGMLTLETVPDLPTFSTTGHNAADEADSDAKEQDTGCMTSPAPPSTFSTGSSQDSGINVLEEKTPDRLLGMPNLQPGEAERLGSGAYIRSSRQVKPPQPVHALVSQFETHTEPDHDITGPKNLSADDNNMLKSLTKSAEFTASAPSLGHHRPSKRPISLDGASRLQKEIPKKGTVMKAKAMFQSTSEASSPIMMCGTDFSHLKKHDGTL